MFWPLWAIFTCIKLLLIPSYRSTDFEVHRNWLAITHSMPISKWYFEDTSEWTLDYPPMFAYFEYLLSHVAKFFDRQMLTVENLNYASYETVLFQRLSVIVTDIIYAIGTRRCAQKLKFNVGTESILCVIMVGNFGLMLVDHIHFQYNGLLFGILLMSISYMLEEKFLKSAFYFAILLNMKHIFLYISPVYIVYLLKIYCYRSASMFDVGVKLSKLAVVTIGVFAASFGPFHDHIPQVLSRLFPFKRGLCHAYWAPNFWAMYNIFDKFAAFLTQAGKGTSSNTGGLVQEYQHQVLPTIYPATTFLLTLLAMIPFIVKFLSKPYNRSTTKFDFIQGIVICSGTSYMFGWHVHEKAVLMTLIPMSLLMRNGASDADGLIFLSAVANYSLLPLIFTNELFVVKYCLYVLYLAVMLLCFAYPQSIQSNVISFIEKLYLFGLIVPFTYEVCLQYLFKLDKRLPFMPLLLTSVYCSIGMMYFWIKMYVGYVGYMGSPKLVGPYPDQQNVSAKQKKQ